MLDVIFWTIAMKMQDACILRQMMNTFAGNVSLVIDNNLKILSILLGVSLDF